MSNSSDIPSPVYLYRIIHIDNLEFILDEQELRCANHPERDPNYTGIGDSTLIKRRGAKDIPLMPGGTFKDYVAFYFGPRSPMLYEIKHGYNGVTQRNQEEIIYLVTTIEKVEEHGCNYVFYDGHAYHAFSNCYNDVQDLEHIDWPIVKAKYWNNREDDMDRKRRKQAEFLIHTSLPWSAIKGICAINDSAKQKVEHILQSQSISCTVISNDKYYY
ncbi:MAG: DUF4433 domain-containing protein [Balneolaceae bacterium]|nr:DUF4433 domain-containing protein [Balneolaceae bacterium]